MTKTPPKNEEDLRGSGEKYRQLVEASPDARKQVIGATIQRVDITAQEQAEEELLYRQRFEHLILDIASSFISMNPGEINDSIQDSLRAIGEFTGADRSFLFLLKEGGRKADNTHEWCAKGIQSDLPFLQDLGLENYALFAEPIMRSEVVYIPRVADLPRDDAWGSVGSVLDRIQSLLLVPIEFRRTVIGCLGLDAVRQERSWPADIATLLHVAGGVFASALERKKAEEARDESEQFLQQVIDNAPFGAHFYHMEDDGRLILTKTNKAADQILKIDHSPMLGKTVEAAFPGLAGTEIPSIYKEIARNGTEYTEERVYSDEAGIKGTYEIIAFQTVPRHMAVFFADITERKRTEAALVEEATRRRILFEQSPDGILIIDPQTMRFLDFNTAAHQQLGYSRAEFAELSIADVDAMETVEDTRETIAHVIREGRSDFETLHRNRQGEIRNVHITAQTVDVLGKSFYQCIWRDTTDQKRAEEEREKLQAQLAQAQKMESVGRLAGGVAHDFNNMLGVIIGHAELALDQTTPEQPLYANLEEIRKAARRSADLTRQLLAFARKQTVVPRVLNLNDAISGLLSMLRRLIGEDIDLVWRPEPDLHPVMIDPAQLDQVLANLCVNARDAIAGVGKITIMTRNATLTGRDRTDCADIVPGKYVVLALSDDGCGMSPDVLDHLFEPFFTTKEVGRGTGLGLATVYGIVKQNEGFIGVTSKQGKGTTFTIYLPPAAAESEETSAGSATKMWHSSGETVLLVEDEQAVLGLCRTILKRMGFAVLTADTPGEAIRQAEEHRGSIDLLITDVVMPEMNGRDLAAQIGLMNPGLRVLFMSGYTADVIAHRGVLEEGIDFIQKPFSIKDMSAKVREMLELK